MRVIYDEFKGFSVERKKFSEKHTMGVPHYHNAYEIFLPIQGMLTLLIGDEIIATDNTNNETEIRSRCLIVDLGVEITEYRN